MSKAHTKLKVIQGTDLRISKPQMRWVVPNDAPRTADDLKFTSRDAAGRIDWWDVTAPQTDYYHVHELLGRAYAFEYLDWAHNPDGDCRPADLSYIVTAMARKYAATGDWKIEAMIKGYLAVIGEMVTTGNANR